MENKKLQAALEKWQGIQPLSETDRNRLSRRFTVDFNYNSNHIEGNTLTYGQTELLLLFGKVSGMAEFRDYEEMKASNVGLKMMSIEALETQQPLTQNFIRTLHKTLLREDYTVYRNLPGGMQTSYTVHAGQYKTRPNSVITRYGDHFEYASPEETPALMTDLVDWYNKAEAEGKLSPVELAVLFHYRYIRIHPFEDGNGRIALAVGNLTVVALCGVEQKQRMTCGCRVDDYRLVVGLHHDLGKTAEDGYLLGAGTAQVFLNVREVGHTGFASLCSDLILVCLQYFLLVDNSHLYAGMLS